LKQKAMLTAVLIDDEPDAISVLSQLLKDYSTTPVKIVVTANNLDDGIALIKSSKPDIVFLDINMPGKSGMDIYKYFENPTFKVIFVTAYNQYAIEALKKSATDYLLKPVQFMELREALAKVSREIEQEQQFNELQDKVNILFAAEMEGKNVVFDVEGGFILENTKNIEYCFADQSYSVIVTFSGKKITISKSLKELQKQLPNNQFYRTHKSYLINIHYIRKFVRSNESYVLLTSGMKIPVSVRTSASITKDIKQMLTN
jgi:two-component system LytT family response regulator